MYVYIRILCLVFLATFFDSQDARSDPHDFHSDAHDVRADSHGSSF